MITRERTTRKIVAMNQLQRSKEKVEAPEDGDTGYMP